MSTRGAFGFLVDGELKVAYNHYDSYPSGAGGDFASRVAALDPGALRSVAQGIVVVQKPGLNQEGMDIGPFSERLALGFERFLSQNPEAEKRTAGGKSLRKRVGDLRGGALSAVEALELIEALNDAHSAFSPEAFWTDGFPLMIDSSAFLSDSLMCEWAWIVNVDEGALEVYRGFNKSPSAPGRYAARQKRAGTEYFGVRLAESIPLDELRSMAHSPGWGAALMALENHCCPEYVAEMEQPPPADQSPAAWLALRESWALSQETPEAQAASKPKLM